MRYSIDQEVYQIDHFLEKFKHKHKIIIGRSKDCDMIIDHPSISRHHISLEKIDDQSFWLCDLSSLNGVFVNQQKISSRIKINAQDRIFMGQFMFSIALGAKHLCKEISIRAENISKVYDQGHIGLHPCHLQIPANTMVAIMGPSGCGKSTLLKALNGDDPPTSGQVYIAGLELKSNYSYLKTHIASVPQDDIVHLELTVHQALRYAARLRMGHASDEEIESKIDEVLSLFKLSNIKDHQIKEISGGQRKRTAIAIELLTNPLVLFLDEPTSPLDPQSVEDFLNTLRELLDLGTTIILVTHKPEDLEFVDEVIFMAEGGHLAYHGNNKSFLEYFGVDHIIKIYARLLGSSSEKWVKKYIESNVSSDFTELKLKIESPKHQRKINLFYQYYWLTIRYFQIKLNHKLNTLILLAQAPLIAGLIILVFKEIELQVLLIIAMSAIWLGVNNAIREIVSENQIYKRERMFNQEIIPYLLSKLTVLSALALIQSASFILVIDHHFKQSVTPWQNPWDSFLFIFFLSLCATMMGLFFSAILQSVEKVMSILPLLIIPQLMLSGVFAKLSSIWAESLSYFTLARWGTEGLSQIQPQIIGVKASLNLKLYQEGCAHLPNIQQMCQLSLNEIPAHTSLKQNYHPSYLQRLGDQEQILSIDLYALLILLILFFIMTYISLKKRDLLKI